MTSVAPIVSPPAPFEIGALLLHRASGRAGRVVAYIPPGLDPDASPGTVRELPARVRLTCGLQCSANPADFATLTAEQYLAHEAAERAASKGPVAIYT